jgi:hypothetical protein
VGVKKDTTAGAGGIVVDVDRLFEAQETSWADLARGLDGLRRARERTFDIGGFPIVARHLPHRIGSTTASVDAAAVSARLCFLCPANRPEEQKGISAGPDFEIFCNPFPILERHVTIVCREHVPQRLDARTPSGGIRRMLEIARTLPGFMVLYNGPASGASAPDHMHFQAALADGVPVFDPDLAVDGGVIASYPGSVIVIDGDELESAVRRFNRAMSLLPAPPEIPEAMINVAVVFTGGEWRVRLFGRARHRPGVFERGEFTWSPGAIDMCGVVVLPVPGDLERLTPDVIARTYREVSIPADSAREIAAQMETP